MRLWPRVFDEFWFHVAATAVVAPAMFAVMRYGTPPQPWMPAEFMIGYPIFAIAGAVQFLQLALGSVYVLRMASGLAPAPFGRKVKSVWWADLAVAFATGMSVSVAAYLLATAFVVSYGVNISMDFTTGTDRLGVLLKSGWLGLWVVVTTAAMVLHRRALSRGAAVAA